MEHVLTTDNFSTFESLNNISYYSEIGEKVRNYLLNDKVPINLLIKLLDHIEL